MYEEQADHFPPKPVYKESVPDQRRSITSMLIFGVMFYAMGWSFLDILTLVIVIIIHELGHYLAMRAFNYKELGIFFIPLLGAYAQGSKERISQRQKLIVVLAGPIPGVILGVLFYNMGIENNHEAYIHLGNLFIILNLFNLLPVIPLDGGKVLQTLFFENNEEISKIFMYISIAIMLFLAWYLESFFMLLIPLYIYSQLKNTLQTKKLKDAILAKGILINKTYDELTDEEYWLIRDEVVSHHNFFKIITQPGSRQVCIQENRIVATIKGIVKPIPTNDINALGKIFVIVIWIAAFTYPIMNLFGSVITP